MENTNPLGTEKISKLIVKFSIPAIVGMMVNAVYNIVDRIYIGNASDLGSGGLAGITVGFPLMIILMAVGVLFGIGGATLFSMKLGEGQPKEAEKALNNSFMILVVSGIILMIMGQIFLSSILRLFGASEEVLPYAEEYMRIIFFGAVFQITNMGMNNFLRADGKPRMAMVTMFVGAGMNIILDPIFIFGFKMGMSGAALATILSQVASTLWILYYFLTKKSNFRLRLRLLKPKKSILFQITALGLPGFFMQIGSSVLHFVLNRSLFAYGGDIAVSGMGIVHSVFTVILMPVIGLNQGVQPIISFNYGARKFKRVKEAEKLAIIAATVVVTVGWILIQIFPSTFVRFFNQEPELVKFGTYALRTWFLCMPVVGFQIMGANFFQAIGRYKPAMFLTLTRQVLFLIPAILLFSSLWGIEGLLYAAPFADGVSAIITAILFTIMMKKLNRMDR